MTPPDWPTADKAYRHHHPINSPAHAGFLISGAMTAYYNEIDPYAAQWLRNLINAGHIAPGIVDERKCKGHKWH